MRLAGIGQPRGFVLRQGFAFELIGHAPIVQVAQEMHNS